MKRIIVLFLCLAHMNSIFPVANKVPFALLRRLLPADAVVLEAGAQYGEDTAWMSEMWPTGKIYAFEPNPESYPALCEIAAKYPNITTFHLALSNKIGEFPFYLSGGASSLLRPTDWVNADYFHADLDHPIMVPVVTINMWAQQHDVTAIDFMWLDMEGNEINALEGALRILSTVKVIFTEVNLQPFWEGCARYEEMLAWMDAHGFEKVWEEIIPSWHGNVLFVNKALNL